MIGSINKINLVFFVIFINSVIESFLMLGMDRTFIISFQFIINIILFLWFIKKGKIIIISLFRYIVFFYVYYLFLCQFSSEFFKSFNYLLKFLIPFFYLIIGYNIVLSKENLLSFYEKGWIINLYFTIHIIISNITQSGKPLYDNGLLIGYYSLNGLYIPTFLIIVNLFLNKHYSNKRIKFLNILFSITTFLIIILILKRTLLLLIIISLLFYIFSHFSFKKIFKILTPIFFVILIISQFYKKEIEKNLAARESRFNKEYSISQEGRFTENKYLFNVLSENIIKLLFGSGEVFNDRETLTELNVYEDEREAHNSYIRIFWNGGLIGLLTFLLLYYKQIQYFTSEYKFFKKKDLQIKELLLFCLMFIVLRFINDFSSGITYLNYNAWSYFLIGGTIGITLNFKKHVRYSGYNKFQI